MRFIPFLFCLCLCGIGTLASSTANNELEFRDGGSWFHYTKLKSELKLEDGYGSRQIQIKPCNQKQVDAFWNELANRYKALQVAKPLAKNGHPNMKYKAWAQYGNVRKTVLPFEKSYSFFMATPKNTLIFAGESERACKK